MRQAYRALLRLYPRTHRNQFGEEMLAVYTSLAEERRAGGWFLYTRFVVDESWGLLGGAFRAWAETVSLAPALGGVVVAAVSHLAFYVGTFKLLHEIVPSAERLVHSSSDPKTAALTLSMFGVASVFGLLPLFFLLNMRLKKRCR